MENYEPTSSSGIKTFQMKNINVLEDIQIIVGRFFMVGVTVLRACDCYQFLEGGNIYRFHDRKVGQAI